jgi:hypothetical protein
VTTEIAVVEARPSRVAFQQATQSPAAVSDAQLSSSGFITLDAGRYVQYSSPNDFSWLSIEAVGDYMANDPIKGPKTHILTAMIGHRGLAEFKP